MRNERFGALLSEGLSSVAKRQHTTLRAVDHDITSELHLKEWTVQGWRRGYVPSQPDHVAFLARYSVASGRVQQEWVYSLLTQARYPTPEALMTELFPGQQRSGAAQRPAPHVAHNLPPLHGEFLDRREELARVLEGLASSWPVISIEGLAGTGKTTLAIAAARRCLVGPDVALDRPFQAVAWVSARDRLEKRLWLDEVLNTVARVLDFPYIIQLSLDQKQMAVDQLLRGHRTLVVVDNFETIEDPELTTWLHQVPEPSKVLITTRHGQLRSGWDTHLAGLEQPDALELVRRHARRLGLARTEAAPEHDLAPLVNVTQGNPRALGMALGYLKGGHRRLADVVEGLYAASQSVGDIFANLFDWHWTVLSPDAQRVLLAMSFFAESTGRAELGAAAGLDDTRLDSALEQLVTMSLFEPHEGAHETYRYRIHPLTRAFATTKAAQPEARQSVQDARERWLAWYRQFARAYAGRDRVQSAIRYDLLQEEWTNLIAVFTWCAANERYEDLKGIWWDDRVEQVAHASSYWPDVVVWSDWLLAEAEQRGDWPAVAHALASKSWALIQMGQPGQLAEATRLLARIWRLRQRTNTSAWFSLVVPCIWLRLRQERYKQGLWWLAQAERVLQRGGLDDEDRARMLIHIPRYRCLAYLELGDLARARASCYQAIGQAQALGWHQPIIHLRNNLADIALREHDLATAERLLCEGLPEAYRDGDKRRIALYKRSYAYLEQVRHQPDAARQWATEALDLFERLGMGPETQELRELLAAVADAV
jgi:LuxR family glucitol operon transcriptional activator